MASKYDLDKLHNWAVFHGVIFWRKAQAFYGIRIGAMPKVIMNSRLTSTGGRTFLEEYKIDLSCFLMERNSETFKNVIIPHELCHLIAYKLYGDKGHGKPWKKVMVEMGLEPNPYHNMESMATIKKRGNYITNA
jgi:SprT protein